MAGLILLFVIGVWLLICGALSSKVPDWLGVKGRTWWVSLLLFPVLVLTPIVDDLIGMHQFQALCDERSVALISPRWREVKRATRVETVKADVPNLWIRIHAYKTVYTDLDTGKEFMSFEKFATPGGRLNLTRLMGGANSCRGAHANELGEQLSRMKMNDLLEAGGIP